MDQILFVTRECNLKCHYCYIEKHANTLMSEETAFKAVDLLLSQNEETKKARLSFFGGEPLINFDVVKKTTKYAVEEAAKKNIAISFSIATNGTLITPEIIDFLEKYKFTVELSLDGNEIANNLNRPFLDGTGSYKNITKNLKELYKRAHHLVAIAVLSPLSAPYIYESSKHVMDELGIKNFVISMDYTGKWTEKDLMILKEQYELLSEWYLEKTRKGDSLFYYSLFDIHIAAHVRGGFKPGSFCDVGRNIYAVAEDGRIFPCVRFAGKPVKAAKYLLGDVRTGLNMRSCKEISDENLKERTECKGCALDGRCITYCPCLNWDTTGKFNSVSGLLCAHESMIVPLADKLAKTLYEEKDPVFMRKHYKKKIEKVSELEIGGNNE